MRTEAKRQILVRLLERTREVEAESEAIAKSRSWPLKFFGIVTRTARFIEERENGPRYEVGAWFPGATEAEAKRYQRAVHDLHAAGLLVGVTARTRLSNVRLTDAGRAEAERLERLKVSEGKGTGKRN